MSSLKAVVLIGIPGIGKSTYAEKWASKDPNHRIIIASDGIRKDLYGDEAEQGDWNEIFDEMEYRIMVASAGMKDIIIDATHTNRQSRQNILHTLWKNGYSEVDGVWFKGGLDKAIKQNSQRSRHVPHHIIKRMHEKLTNDPPRLVEGFNRLLEVN